MLTITLTDKQRYFLLLGEVCEKLKADAVDKTVRSDYPTTANLLETTRIGRRPNLPDLVRLVEIGLPDFEIPAHLRPAA